MILKGGIFTAFFYCLYTIMIRCFTLFDLGSEQNPSKNWTSLLQSISLYADFEVISFPRKVYREITNLDFGELYVGFHNVWLFDFESKNNTNINDLSKIIQHLPIICGLNETVKIHLKCALVDSINKNISFLLIENPNK
jgi:hypothetical protein